MTPLPAANKFLPIFADLLKKGKQALFGLGGVGKTQLSRRSWDPNDRPESTEVQAFPGLPADAALGPTT
jgi:hypothetical protein